VFDLAMANAVTARSPATAMRITLLQRSFMIGFSL
jgi:hypothetical protein